MCLSVPVKIIRLEEERAIGTLGGAEIKISLDLVDDVNVNDYVLVHTGFAIEKISEEEAIETMALLEKLKED